MTAAEFRYPADASTCEGDSGSNLFEQKNFSAGNWVSFGVLSRGGVSADNTTCVQPIYSRFDAWGPLLIAAATEAAAMGGYGVPPWAGGTAPNASGASSGASSGEGEGVSCAADGECASQNCIGVNDGGLFCREPCVNAACPAHFQCLSGYCFPDSAQDTQVQASHSGGCSVASIEATRSPAATRAAFGGARICSWSFLFAGAAQNSTHERHLSGF